MRFFATLLLGGCVHMASVEPASELTVMAVSSAKDPSLAENIAKARATARAGHIKQGLAFVLDRSRGKPMLKLVFDGASAGVIPSVEARKPIGARAKITLQRSPEERQALGKRVALRLQTRASGLDLAVAQDRADRNLYKEAILAFANAAGRKDIVLSGRLTIINYQSDEQKDGVSVQADIAVEFGALDATAPKKQDGVSEELEEVEPPEEQR